MKLATWNVNSVRAREAHVGRFLERVQPDFLLLQEIKCETGQFPAATFKALGYDAVAVGQKAYNGVAILSRRPFEVVHERLPGLDEEAPQARYVEIRSAALTIGNLYLPNGNSGGDEGYRAKIAWMAALRAHAATLLARDADLILAGDYNVCPEDVDFARGTLSAGDALVRPETRAQYRGLIFAGLTDAQRAVLPSGPAYTFWDYQAGSWPQDRGLRIDLALLSPHLAERLTAVAVDKEPRGETQPSDHTPLVIEIEIAGA